MDRLLRLVRPWRTAGLTAVALGSMVALLVRPAARGPIGRAADPPIAAPSAAEATCPSTVLQRTTKSCCAADRANWLPPLLDDTRTVLTGFAFDRPLGIEPASQPGQANEAGGLVGPHLVAPRSTTLEDGAAPWYPETPSSRASTEEPPRLLIVPADACGHRSAQLEQIAREADMHSRRGFELAGRGAYFSAQSQFIRALRLVAQGLDAERASRLHSTALAAGLAALEEAEEFFPNGSRLEADLDLAGIIAAHRCPVLRGADVARLTPMAALQCYFTYAQEQLAAAMDREVAGSMALYGLGKLHKTLSEQQPLALRAARPKAMAFYQASLLVYPQNHLSSNDLGVLLAQAGRYEDARIALEHSLAIRQSSTAWHNLAVVYQNLGQGELARRAEWLAQTARRAEVAQAGPQPPGDQQPVIWVDPAAFAQHRSAPRPINVATWPPNQPDPSKPSRW